MMNNNEKNKTRKIKELGSETLEKALESMVEGDKKSLEDFFFKFSNFFNRFF